MTGEPADPVWVESGWSDRRNDGTKEAALILGTNVGAFTLSAASLLSIASLSILVVEMKWRGEDEKKINKGDIIFLDLQRERVLLVDLHFE